MVAYLACFERAAERVELLADEGDTVIDPLGDIDLGAEARAVITGRAGVWTLAQQAWRPGGPVTGGTLVDGATLSISGVPVRFGIGDPSRALDDARYLRATVDGLTGMFTRAFLHASLARARPPGALLAIDLDWFKRVNDQRGLLVGDLVLRTTAARIRACTAWPELVARYGGEEFAVVLPGATLDEARIRAEAIRVACEAPLVADGDAVTATVSIGVAPLAIGPTSLRAADDNLVRAKVAGRNRVVG